LRASRKSKAPRIARTAPSMSPCAVIMIVSVRGRRGLGPPKPSMPGMTTSAMTMSTASRSRIAALGARPRRVRRCPHARGALDAAGTPRSSSMTSTLIWTGSSGWAIRPPPRQAGRPNRVPSPVSLSQDRPSWFLTSAWRWRARGRCLDPQARREERLRPVQRRFVHADTVVSLDRHPGTPSGTFRCGDSLLRRSASLQLLVTASRAFIGVQEDLLDLPRMAGHRRQPLPCSSGARCADAICAPTTSR
jgi:hypothetical protein